MKESKYEKLLRKNHYPDPEVFSKEKNRIKETLKHSITYFEKQIRFHQKQINSLKLSIKHDKQKLKELN